MKLVFRNSIYNLGLHKQFLTQNHLVCQCVDANQRNIFSSLFARVFLFSWLHSSQAHVSLLPTCSTLKLSCASVLVNEYDYCTFLMLELWISILFICMWCLCSANEIGSFIGYLVSVFRSQYI